MSDASFVHVNLMHGLAPGWMAQAARVILALGAKHRVVVPWDVRDAAWPLFLNLDEQYQLAMLSDDARREEALDALRKSPGAEHRVAFVGAGPVHAGVHELAWLMRLGITQEPDQADARRSVALGAGTVQAFLAGPPSEGVWRAPHLLADLWFEPGAALGPATLCLVDDRPVAQGLLELVQQRRKHPGPWILFDPWDRWTKPAVTALLPKDVQAVGPQHDAHRRATFARCKQYLTWGTDRVLHAPFEAEAHALGLARLCEGDGPQGMAVTQAVGLWLPHLLGHAPQPARHLEVAPGKTVRLVGAPQHLSSGQGASALMLVGPPPEATAPVVQAIAKRGYRALFCQTGVHMPLLPGLMMASLSRMPPQPLGDQHAQTPEGQWQAAASWLERAEGAAQLDVWVLGGQAAQMTAAWVQARTLAMRHTASRSLLPTPMPRLVMSAGEDPRKMGASAHTIGGSVASDDISWSTLRAAQDRLEVKWLRPGDRNYDIRQIFLHPLGRPGQAGRCYDEPFVWSPLNFRRSLAQNGVDALMITTGPSGADFNQARAHCAKKPVPMVSVLHGLMHPPMQHDILKFMLNGPIYPFDAFIVPSKVGKRAFDTMWSTLRAWLVETGASFAPPQVHTEVIPYGVDTAFYAARHRASVRRDLGLPADEVIILSLSRISRRYKACFLPLLLAMKELLAKNITPRLIIAGSPPTAREVTRLEEAARDLGLGEQVSFRTDVSLEDKAQLLTAADVYVAMSDTGQETHGIAPIEAMAAGLPVVAAAWDGFRELVVHEETGYLIPTAWAPIPDELLIDNGVDKVYTRSGYEDLHETVVIDIGRLAQALEHLVLTPHLRREMGARGQARARALFDVRRQGEVMARFMVERIALAQKHAAQFVPPQNTLPLDRLSERFAHYPTQTLGLDDRVIAGPSAQDAAYRQVVAQYIGALDREDTAALERVAKRAASGPVPLSELCDQDVDLLRLMRCLKYGLLQPATPPTL